MRLFPNLFIVGAAKAGTTSLYAYLKQHPQIYMSPVKEPHFFSRVNPRREQRHIVQAIREREAYLALFEGAEGYPVAGEASPSYLWDKEAPYRIREAVPDARIVILLRDPIDRAYSHYLMDVREGIQALPFYEALVKDYQSREKGWGISHLYVELGLYYEQVKRYIETFEKDRLLILMFEDLRRDPRMVVRKVIDFLDLDAEPLDRLDTNRAFNQYAAPRSLLSLRIMRSPLIRSLARVAMPRSVRGYIRDNLLLKRGPKPPLDEEARRFLREIYEPDVRELEKLLDIDSSVLRKVW